MSSLTLPFLNRVLKRRWEIWINREYSFTRADITKKHKLNGLQILKLIVLHFWRLDIQDQGVSRTMFPLKILKKDLFQASLLAFSSSLACDSIGPISTWSYPCMCIYAQIPPFIRIKSYWMMGPPHFSRTSSELITSVPTLFPNKVIFWGSGGRYLQHWGTED